MVFKLFEVVKYDDDGVNFAWRYPNTDVKLGTTIVVAPEQIAFWVSNGVLVSVVGPGKHKINGNYVQGLSWVTSRFTGGVVPSSGEIWFISTGQRDLTWGTPNRVPVNVNYSNAFRATAQLAANGNIQVALGTDAERIWTFINRLKGLYGGGDSVPSAGLSRFVQDNILDEIQAGIAQVINAIDYGNHVTQLPALGRYIKDQNLEPVLEPFGLEVTKFQVKTLDAGQEFVAKRQVWWDRLSDAEASKYEQMRLAEGARYGIEQTGFGTAASRQAQGFTYQEERQFDVLQDGAGNSGVGGDYMSAGVGLAMGSQMGSVMGGMFVQAAEDVEQSRATQGDVPAPPSTPAFIIAGDLSGGAAAPGQGPSTQPGTAAPVPMVSAGGNPADTSVASEQASQISGETKFCMHCGSKIAAAAKFCPSCGGAQ